MKRPRIHYILNEVEPGDILLINHRKFGVPYGVDWEDAVLELGRIEGDEVQDCEPGETEGGAGN